MIHKILEYYNIPGELIKIEMNDSGNINKTIVATFLENGIEKKYLIQRINTTVFPEPYKLMRNIMGVTEYIRKESKMIGDTEHKTLDIVRTKNGKALCRLPEENAFYRIYEYIENAVSYDKAVNPEVVYNTGRAFGNFQRLLSDYPMECLEETIKDFHNTPKRLQKLLEDIKIDSQKRVMDVAREIVFILQRGDICSKISSKLGTKEIPLRVTHNDTKVNNVLMNNASGDFLAVIDLDTVMPGSLLYDYGDGIRSTAANAAEDETNLEEVTLNLSLFEQYTDGYMSEMAMYLTETEVSLMAESIRIIALELGIRFLNDYINGDTYFKINYPTHNLDRARNQLKLAYDVENKLDYLSTYIYKSYKKHKSEQLLKLEKKN